MKSEPKKPKPFIGLDEYGMLRFRDEGKSIVIYNAPFHYLYGNLICLAVGTPLSFLLYYLWYNGILSKTPIVILTLIGLIIVACLHNMFENLFQRHTVRFDFQYNNIELIKSTFGLKNTTTFAISDIQNLRVTTVQKDDGKESEQKQKKNKTLIAYQLSLQLNNKDNIPIIEICDIVRLKPLLQRITKTWGKQCQIFIDPSMQQDATIG